MEITSAIQLINVIYFTVLEYWTELYNMVLDTTHQEKHHYSKEDPRSADYTGGL